jgi:hypothetical protein
MTAIHSSKYWAPCTCGGDRPCAMHPEPPSTGNNLSDEQDLRAADLEVLVRQLYLSLKDHPPETCSACMGTFLRAGETLKRLGIHV